MLASFFRVVREVFTRRAARDQTVRVESTVRAFESLEERKFLSVTTFTVDSTAVRPAAAAIYLEANSIPGEVEIHYGSPTGFFAFTFTGTGDTDQIISPSANVTFFNQVPAAAQPTGGIDVASGLHGTAEFDAGPSDQGFTISTSTSTSTSVDVLDTSSLTRSTYINAVDTASAGIDKIVLRTNGDSAATTFFDPNANTSLATDGSYVSVTNLAPAIHLVVDTGQSTYTFVQLGGGDNTNVTDAEIHTGAGHDAVLVTADDGLDVDAVSTASVSFGAGNGTADGLGLGNSLTVGSGGTAQLVLAGTDTRVVADTVKVDNGGTVKVVGAAIVGTLTVDSGGSALVNAASKILTLDNNGTSNIAAPSIINTLTGGGTTEFIGTAGSSTVGAINAPDGTVKVDSGATVTVFNASTVNKILVAGIANIQGRSTIGTLGITGDVHLNQFILETRVDIGTLTIGAPSASASGGLLDIGRSYVYLTSTPAAFTAAQQYWINGYNINSADSQAPGLLGDWTGRGGITNAASRIGRQH